MEVYAQRLERVHSLNWKTKTRRTASQTQRVSFFKYPSVIKAFLAGLTCDVLRARLRQAADKNALTLIGFLEVHHDNIAEVIKSTCGPLFLVYPKHGTPPDLSKWNSRLLCTALLASDCLDARDHDDVIYLCSLSKRYFHNKQNGGTGSLNKYGPQSRRTWTKLFKIVQRLVASVNDINLIRQVRNFICKIEMEACKVRTRTETQIRLESLIADMIADRIQPQHKKNELTEEAIHEFRRQLINISHITKAKMIPQFLRPQSAGHRNDTLKTIDHLEPKMFKSTNNRPRTAVRRSSASVKRRPVSAHTTDQNSLRKCNTKKEQNKRPSSANVSAEKQRETSQEKTMQPDKKMSVSAKKKRTESDIQNKKYIDSGGNARSVIVMYDEQLKGANGIPRLASPPVVKDSKVTESLTKVQARPHEKSGKILPTNEDKRGNTAIENRENETIHADWKDNMMTITNEVLVHQNFHKAVTNPLLENKDFINDFITYLNHNHVLKQFLHIQSTDPKQCFKLPHGRAIQLSFFIAFVSRHIEPRHIESAVYTVEKLLHYMKCKCVHQSNTTCSHSSSMCITCNQKCVNDGNKESEMDNTGVSIRGEENHTRSDLNSLTVADSNEKTVSDHRSRSRSRGKRTRPFSNLNTRKVQNTRGTKTWETNTSSGKRRENSNEISRSARLEGKSGEQSKPSVRSRSGSSDRRQKLEHNKADASDDAKDIATRNSTYNASRCWRCAQKEAAMRISINWGNKRICDTLLAEGVPYVDEHVIAAVNANDLDALTAIVTYLREKRCWMPEGEEATLALKLAVKYRMQNICAFLKAEGVTLEVHGNKSCSEQQRICPSCFIT